MSNKILSKDISYIYLWEGQSLFIGHSLQTKTHAHHAIQIGISVEGCFKVNPGNGIWEEYAGIIVGSDQEHECIALGNKFIFISLEPESPKGRSITQCFLQDNFFSTLDEKRINKFIIDLENLLINPSDCSAITCLINNFINMLICPFVPKWKKIDARIARVINFIKKDTLSQLTLQQLANETSLSQSRLGHLFKEQVGIPIRKYRLWLKLNVAMQAIINNKDFTESAYLAGFSDSAHFSRTFSRMFGISPSDILKSSQFVQAYLCSL